MSTSSPDFLFTSKKLSFIPTGQYFQLRTRLAYSCRANMATPLPTEERHAEASTVTAPTTQESQPPNTDTAPEPAPAPAQSQKAAADDDDDDSDFDELDGNTSPPLLPTPPPPPHTPPRGMIHTHTYRRPRRLQQTQTRPSRKPARTFRHHKPGFLNRSCIPRLRRRCLPQATRTRHGEHDGTRWRCQ